jgi:hypothetical protein
MPRTEPNIEAYAIALEIEMIDTQSASCLIPYIFRNIECDTPFDGTLRQTIAKAIETVRLSELAAA